MKTGEKKFDEFEELVLELDMARIIFAEEEEEEEEEEARIVVSMKDITDRKLAEEALRQSEEKYRDIFDKAVEGIYRTTPAGRFFILNPAFATICGYASPEEMKEKVTDIANQLYANPEDRLRFQKLIADEGEVNGFEVQFKHPTKGLVWVSIHSKVIHDEQGNIRYYDGAIEDITESKRAAEALIESEARYRSLFENNHAVMLLINPDNAAITDANAAACAYYGWSRDELMKRRIDEINTLTSEEVYAEMKLARSEKRNHFFFKHRRADGTIRDVEVYSGPILLKGKTMLYSLVHDIMDRRQAEEESRASHSQLRALAVRLQQIREEERVMIAREIHDEMGGGLTGLKMDLSWLLRKMSDADPGEERVALMDRIHTSNTLIDHMIRMVRRISTDLRPSVLDDLGLIAALEWQLSEFTKRTEIPHEFSTTFEYIHMEEHIAVAVFRIFQEALTNVGRHSRATKVAVDLREGQRSLFGDETLVLEIRDNGRGITEEEIQNPESLGLLGMKERVLTFRGNISISGEPGGGTTLVLKIPQHKIPTSQA
jgi:PAS domain S-box-containing protein